MKSLVRFAVVSATLLGSAGFLPAAQADSEPDPVVFVHGFRGHGADWDSMKSRFVQDGYTEDELFAFEYDSSISNVDVAKRLSRYVDDVRAKTGQDRVDVVTHSMGGLNSRYWLKFLGGDRSVDDWVSLAGPNHGSDAPDLCPGVPCTELRPDSKFLAKLNRGDETPGDVHYGTFWSACEEAVVPPESTVLDGASNTEVGCLRHLDFLTDEDVYTRVRDFVS